MGPGFTYDFESRRRNSRRKVGFWKQTGGYSKTECSAHEQPPNPPPTPPAPPPHPGALRKPWEEPCAKGEDERPVLSHNGGASSESCPLTQRHRLLAVLE